MDEIKEDEIKFNCGCVSKKDSGEIIYLCNSCEDYLFRWL